MVVPVVCRRIDDETFATERAFATHLVALYESMADFVDEIVIAGIGLDDAGWAAKQAELGVVHRADVPIRFVPLFEGDPRPATYMSRVLPSVVRKLKRLIAEADIVAAGPDIYAWRPMSFPALILGRALGKLTVSTTDIDQRRSPKMRYESGMWDRRAYWTTRAIHQPALELQHRAIVKLCDLVMMKGQAMKSTYGPKDEHVKVVMDTAYSVDQVLGAEDLDAKVVAVRERSEPLRLVYFGRFVAYKGVPHMIEAIARSDCPNLELAIIGSGPEKDAYVRAVDRWGVADRVRIEPPRPYGPELFARVRAAHLLLAAPLSEDTPRSLWDAFAAGVGVVAYDSIYYSDLAGTGAIELVPWNQPERMGERLRELEANRDRVADMMRKAREAALENPQPVWLERRASWMREMVERGSKRTRAKTGGPGLAGTAH